MFNPMASGTTPRSFYGVINISTFLSIKCTIKQPKSTSRHAVLAFLAPTLLEFLEFQYQGKVCSPFQTHPKTMSVAIVSLLLYCLAYDAELRFSSTPHSPSQSRVVGGGMVLFGSIFALSLAYVLLQDNSAGLVLFLLFVLFSVNVLLNCRIKMYWKWLWQRMMSGLDSEPEMPERHMKLAVITGVHSSCLYGQGRFTSSLTKSVTIISYTEHSVSNFVTDFCVGK
ncbi:unnamed protein product [Camellia sinensis]